MFFIALPTNNNNLDETPIQRNHPKMIINYKYNWMCQKYKYKYKLFQR